VAFDPVLCIANPEEDKERFADPFAGTGLLRQREGDTPMQPIEQGFCQRLTA
jgi:hypothetical protein